MKLDVRNETDEDIVIPSGETLRLWGDKESWRTQVSRRETSMVNRTGTDPMDGVTFVTCEDCGEKVPADILDAGAHKC